MREEHRFLCECVYGNNITAKKNRLHFHHGKCDFSVILGWRWMRFVRLAHVTVGNCRKCMSCDQQRAPRVWSLFSVWSLVFIWSSSFTLTVDCEEQSGSLSCLMCDDSLNFSMRWYFYTHDSTGLILCSEHVCFVLARLMFYPLYKRCEDSLFF